MTQELILIEEIFNLYNRKLQPNTIIYKDKRMKQRRDTLVYSSYLLMFLLLLPLLCLQLKYPNYPMRTIIYFLVYALIPVCIHYFLLNPKDKAQLKALGIPASNCFWKSWYNNIGYHKYKINLFTEWVIYYQ